MNTINKYNNLLGAGKKCALLVSDMQRAYTEGMLDADFRMEDEIKIIQQLIEIAHANNIPVIYTVIVFDEYEILHPNMWLQKIPQLMMLKAGSTAVELDPRFLFKPDKDLLLIKKHTSAFFATPLANQLLCQGIDTLLVTGCTTSGCVRATTVEGLENGFRVMVVKDAVADRWPASHEQSLFEINAKYGDIIDSMTVIEIMNKNNKV